ncbi:MAG: GyrI-like domain-containing protein [SAR202 cluster bacterium]|nr:GyrI-like domain-containing protein [SAR202 cluster bacterium]
MAYDVGIVDCVAQPAVVLRLKVRRQDFLARFPAALAEVTDYVRNEGGSLAGPPFCTYHEFGAFAIDFEAGVPVERPLAGGERVRAAVTYAGKAAATTHVGPIASVRPAHIAVNRWIERHGARRTGQPMERYLAHETAEPGSADWRTQVLWPIAAEAGAGGSR